MATVTHRVTAVERPYEPHNGSVNYQISPAAAAAAAAAAAESLV